MITAGIEITATGWLTTFQDLGRRDCERLGVPTGGAADQHSATVANLLAGNPPDATLLENLGGGLAFTADHDLLVAVTGAPDLITVDGAPAPSWTPLVVPAGRELRVEGVQDGSRVYLAVHGALNADVFLGSSAPDARMGFGQVVSPGTRVQARIRPLPDRFAEPPLFRLPVPKLPLTPGPWTVDVVETSGTATIPGIRELIADSAYTVTDRSNHVGLRLAGPVRHPPGDAEIVSHGVPIGALEIPHADELIVLGRYRTLTAGYPIVGVAARNSLPLLGQAGPGRELRFRWISREEAVRSAVRRADSVRALAAAAGKAFRARGIPCPGTK